MRAVYYTRPEDVQAHLIFASAEIGNAVITCGDQQIHGSIDTPDPMSGKVIFTLDISMADSAMVPPAGRTLQVSYEHEASAYSFLTEFEGVDMLGRWMFQAPRTVERTDRRLVYRHHVVDAGGFQIEFDHGNATHCMPLMDVSNSGLAITFEAGEIQPVVGECIHALLTIPGNPPVPVDFQVRHIRINPQTGREMMGARYVGITAGERYAISRCLAVWSQNQKDTSGRAAS